jgi:predicted permease
VIRLVRGLLRRVVPGDWAEDLLGDLEVSYRCRRERRGRVRAAVWLAWHTSAFALRFGWERLREGAGSGAGDLWGSAAQDIRFTLRSARRAPVFFASVVITLAVGIGANTTIFTVVRTVLLDPLPYPEADRLVVLAPYPWIPTEVVQGLEGDAAGVEVLAGFYPHRFVVTGGEHPAEVEGAVVTPDLLDLLGAEVALGRGFTADDARPGAPATVVLAHGAGRRLFGDPREALGRTVRLDGRPHRVVGVLDAGFRQLAPRTDDPEVWTPARLDRLSAGILDEGSVAWAIPVARLTPGGAERAREALEAAAARHVENDPEIAASRRWGELRWAPLQRDLVGEARAPLLLLQAAVALVLVLACANVATLLLARAGSRDTELALRTALGASRARVLRQVLTEGIVLSVSGGGLGLVVSALSLDLLVALAPPGIPRLDAVGVDALTAAFAASVTLAAGVLFGIIPGWFASRTSPARSLKEGGRTATASRRRHRMGQALVVGELTLTLVLLVGAGLVVRSFLELTGEDPGFRTADVLAVPLAADRERYDDAPTLESYQTQLLEQVGRVPGVASVALANNLPHRRSGAVRSLMVEGEGEPREAQYSVVSSDYFGTLDIPLERGRPLRPSDVRGAPSVAVVDRAMAGAVWPGVDPVGRRFRLEGEERWITVVGVSADVRGAGLRAAPGPGFHIAYTQRPGDAVEVATGRSMVLLVRAREGAGQLDDALRRAVWEVDPGQPVPQVARLDRMLARTTTPERFRAVLMAAFAAVALVMAVVGVYGIVAQLVGERARELGVRKALGATSADLVGDVLAWGLRLTAVGVVMGSAGVFLTSRLLSGLLYGVAATDPATVVGAAVTVVLVTLAACLVPAVRAARVDTRVTLSGE